MGPLTDAHDLFVTWTNARYVQWRKDLFSYEAKKKPCTTCMYGALANEIPEMPWIVAQWRRTLTMDAAPSSAPALA